MIASEEREQMLFVQWFRRTHAPVRIFAIPNGGHRHIAVAAKLKACGATAGVPDLFVPAWHLWIEMKKDKGGSVSPEQKDWIAYLEGVQYVCIVGKGCQDAIEKVTKFLEESNNDD